MPTLVNKQTYLESGQQSETKRFSGVSYIDTHFSTGEVDEARGDGGGPIKWAKRSLPNRRRIRQLHNNHLIQLPARWTAPPHPIVILMMSVQLPQ